LTPGNSRESGQALLGTNRAVYCCVVRGSTPPVALPDRRAARPGPARGVPHTPLRSVRVSPATGDVAERGSGGCRRAHPTGARHRAGVTGGGGGWHWVGRWAPALTTAVSCAPSGRNGRRRLPGARLIA